MTTIKPGDTMTDSFNHKHTVLDVTGIRIMEIESNETGCRLLLGYWDNRWSRWSDGEPWTHTPSRPTITNSGQRLIADGSHYAFALIGEDGDLPEGWDASKVAAAVAKHLNEVDLDEVTATEATP